jgi:maltose-binding protein MalE
MKKTTITVSMLNDHKACQEQIERFRKCFGESVKVTVRRAPSVANEFEWDLAAG